LNLGEGRGRNRKSTTATENPPGISEERNVNLSLIKILDYPKKKQLWGKGEGNTCLIDLVAVDKGRQEEMETAHRRRELSAN